MEGEAAEEDVTQRSRRRECDKEIVTQRDTENREHACTGCAHECERVRACARADLQTLELGFDGCNVHRP
jgi:hypothetical protein